MSYMFRIFTTGEFDLDYDGLDNSIKEQIDKELKQLENNPYVGKPLGYKFFREKRVKNYRFYYLIYEEHCGSFCCCAKHKKRSAKNN